jgi:hypothetical protein
LVAHGVAPPNVRDNIYTVPDLAPSRDCLAARQLVVFVALLPSKTQVILRGDDLCLILNAGESTDIDRLCLILANLGPSAGIRRLPAVRQISHGHPDIVWCALARR